VRRKLGNSRTINHEFGNDQHLGKKY